MKITKRIVFSVTGLTVAALTAVAVPGHRFGTDIFHFRVQTAMVNQGVEPAATGSVSSMHDVQGHANIQKLDITVDGLMPNTPYELDASTDNNSSFFGVVDFTTDASGKASLHYQKVGNGQGNGHGRAQLPVAVDPVNAITGLAIVDTNFQSVLTADLLSPDRLQVLIKRDISSDQVPALLFIHANDNEYTIKLAASNLATNSPYGLAVNGNVVQVNNSDANGRLAIGTTFSNATDVLDLTSVSLVDNSGTNVVVGTSLP